MQFNTVMRLGSMSQIKVDSTDLGLYESYFSISV